MKVQNAQKDISRNDAPLIKTHRKKNATTQKIFKEVNKRCGHSREFIKIVKGVSL
jgi:hypothetical protein